MIVIGMVTFLQYQDGAGWMQKYSQCNGELIAIKAGINNGVVQSGIIDPRLHRPQNQTNDTIETQ